MKNIILFGMKNSGKSTLAALIAEKNTMKHISIDDVLSQFYRVVYGESLSFRDIHRKHGGDYFRQFETNIVKMLADFHLEGYVIDCGGGTPLREENQQLLRTMGKLVWVKLDPQVNYERIMQNGIPSFFKYQDDPKRSYDELIAERFPIYEKIADYTIEFTDETPEQVFQKCADITKDIA